MAIAELPFGTAPFPVPRSVNRDVLAQFLGNLQYLVVWSQFCYGYGSIFYHMGDTLFVKLFQELTVVN